MSQYDDEPNCPYCKSKFTEWVGLDFKNGEAHNDFDCEECDKSFTAVYKFDRIKEEDSE